MGPGLDVGKKKDFGSRGSSPTARKSKEFESADCPPDEEKRRIKKKKTASLKAFALVANPIVQAAPMETGRASTSIPEHKACQVLL